MNKLKALLLLFSLPLNDHHQPTCRSTAITITINLPVPIIYHVFKLLQQRQVVPSRAHAATCWWSATLYTTVWCFDLLV